MQIPAQSAYKRLEKVEERAEGVLANEEKGENLHEEEQKLPQCLGRAVSEKLINFEL